MKQKSIISKIVIAVFMIAMLSLMAFNVAAAISHTIDVGSTVYFRAVGKVKATVTLADSQENAVLVSKDGQNKTGTNGSITIEATDQSVEGSLSFGDTIELVAADAAAEDLSYSYTLSIKNDYNVADIASYKNLKATFTPPEANACVTITYDANFTWTAQGINKVVTLEPQETAKITVTFATNVSVSNAADMSSSLILENSQPEIWNGGVASTFAGGKGTSGDPYLISNGEQLALMSYLINNKPSYTTCTGVSYTTENNITKTINVTGGSTQFKNAHYKQTANIYLNDGAVINEAGELQVGNWQKWTSIGTSDNKFEGTYDGNFKIVSGLYINNTNTFVGLFGFINGTLKNVGTVNNYVAGADYAGGVSGGSQSAGVITNCYNTGTIYASGGDFGYSHAGGVCGGNLGTITNCYNTGAVSGKYYVGGVCGQNYNTISNCYNTGDVSGENKYVGGVCGQSENGTTINCYNTGTVSGGEQVGGVCGWNKGGTITNCHNVGAVTGGSSVAGVCGMQGGTISLCYYLVGGTTDANAVAFDSNLTLASSVIVGEYTEGTQDLLAAMNEWVAVNITAQVHYNSWVSNGLTPPYPVFA